MKRSLVLVIRALYIPAALFCIVQLATAAEVGRSFNATYRLSNIVEDGDVVHVTMTLKLMNPGSAEVNGGIVALLNSQPHHALIDSFSAIKTLPPQGQVTVSHTFALPAEEYGKWQRGERPQLEFLVPSGDTAIHADILANQVIEPVKAN
jgi:hypothetical protein